MDSLKRFRTTSLPLPHHPSYPIPCWLLPRAHPLPIELNLDNHPSPSPAPLLSSPWGIPSIPLRLVDCYLVPGNLLRFTVHCNKFRRGPARPNPSRNALADFDFLVFARFFLPPTYVRKEERYLVQKKESTGRALSPFDRDCRTAAVCSIYQSPYMPSPSVYPPIHSSMLSESR